MAYADADKRITKCFMRESRNENSTVMIPLKYQLVRWHPAPEGYIEAISDDLVCPVDAAGNPVILSGKEDELPKIEKFEAMPGYVLNGVHQFD